MKRKLPKAVGQTIDDMRREAPSGGQEAGAPPLDDEVPDRPAPRPALPAPIDGRLRLAQARAIVERHATYAAVGGLIPVPFGGIAAVSAIVMRMVKVLAEHYRVPFERDLVRTIVTGLLGGAAPAAAGVLTTSSLMRLVPGANLFGVAVFSLTAAAYTRTAGLFFVRHFEKGGSLDDLHPDGR